jgi:hypothetical protein
LEPVGDILQLSAIDDRLPDVQIVSKRYFDGRTKWAVDSRTNSFVAINSGTVNSTTTSSTIKAWVCSCRIAGLVYNRSEGKCGHCGKDCHRSERTAEWGFPQGKDDSMAWALERLDAKEVQPFSDKHQLSLPRTLTNRMVDLPIKRSGILFVILRAIEFDHDTSYRTAVQPVVCKRGNAKIQNVIGLLISSGELVNTKAETKKIYKVLTPIEVRTNYTNSSRALQSITRKKRKKQKTSNKKMTTRTFPKIWTMILKKKDT